MQEKADGQNTGKFASERRVPRLTVAAVCHRDKPEGNVAKYQRCEWRIDQRSADAWPSSSPVIASGDVDEQTVAIVERAIAAAQEVPCHQQP